MFTFLAVSLSYSITTIDFIFLEKISYLATIGVSSLIVYIYMVQAVVTLFSQAMVNNALYHYSKSDEDFSRVLSAGLIYLLTIALILSVVIFFSKDYLLSFFKLSVEAKKYALEYITYMIIFLVIYSISQYYIYIIYSLHGAWLNIFYMASVIILNILFNYISYKFGFGVKGVAIASGLAVLCVMPICVWFTRKKNIFLVFNIKKEFYKKAFIGTKKLGFAAILEPFTHQFIQFFIAIVVAKMGAELLSARYHAKNLLLFSTALSMAFAISIQIKVSSLYGQGRTLEVKRFYIKYLKYSILISFVFTLITVIIIAPFVNYITENIIVARYIIVAMLLGILMEPARAASINSKAFLKGLQSANIPLVFSIANKALLTLPLCYIILNYSTLGLIGILLVESFGYFMNFLLYQALIWYNLKKLNNSNTNLVIA